MENKQTNEHTNEIEKQQNQPIYIYIKYVLYKVNIIGRSRDRKEMERKKTNDSYLGLIIMFCCSDKDETIHSTN